MLSTFKKLFVKIVFNLYKIKYEKGLKVEGIPKIVKTKNSEIIIGKNLLLRKNVEIRAVNGSKLIFGDNVRIDNGVRIIAANRKKLEIGHNVKLGYYSVINGGGGVKICDNVSLYGFVYLQTSTHHDKGHLFKKDAEKIYSHQSIEIGCNTIIGPHCSIMPGVKIGTNTTIGANAVITEDIPDEVLFTGIPKN